MGCIDIFEKSSNYDAIPSPQASTTVIASWWAPKTLGKPYEYMELYIEAVGTGVLHARTPMDPDTETLVHIHPRGANRCTPSMARAPPLKFDHV